MENKVGLYRMLIDASCAIFQNLSAISVFMTDEALNSAKKSLRVITGSALAAIDEEVDEIMKDNE